MHKLPSSTRRLFLLVPLVGSILAGCGSPEPADVVEKAKRIHELRKEADDCWARWLQSQNNPDGPDLAALKRSIACHEETTRITPAACPVCFANHARGLTNLGAYYENQLRALEPKLESLSGDEKQELQAKIDEYREEMFKAFQLSNRQFENYFESARQTSTPVDPDFYRWVLFNCEFLRDFHKALYYLDLYVASVQLTDEGKKNAEHHRTSYQLEIKRQQEEKLRQDLSKESGGAKDSQGAANSKK